VYARNVSFRLKSNMQSDYTRTFENQILPLLRKQKGFKEEISLCSTGSQDAVSISLWENKSNADDYNTNTYPEVLKTLAKAIDGTPRVHMFETVISTFHNVPRSRVVSATMSNGKAAYPPSQAAHVHRGE
jgi:hypothetical protein